MDGFSWLETVSINNNNSSILTYDHRLVRTGHPVRSAILKHQIGRSVVGWVTTSESLLLYVYLLQFFGRHPAVLWSFVFWRRALWIWRAIWRSRVAGR